MNEENKTDEQKQYSELTPAQKEIVDWLIIGGFALVVLIISGIAAAL